MVVDTLRLDLGLTHLTWQISDHILFQFYCPADGVIIFVITCPIDTRVVI